jgi:hypothetical protein
LFRGNNIKKGWRFQFALGKTEMRPKPLSGGKLGGQSSQWSTFNRPRSVPAIKAEEEEKKYFALKVLRH